MHPPLLDDSILTTQGDADAEYDDDTRDRTDAVLAGFDRDVLLSNGRTVRIRPSQRSDISALRGFYGELSDRSSFLRFFGGRSVLGDEQLHPGRGQNIDERIVLVAWERDVIAGIGEYWRVPARAEAEVAFAVADAHHHEGIATMLLEDLALLARAAGLTRLVAETMADNEAMLDVFRSVGLTMRSWYEQNQMHIELDLSGDHLLEDEADGRDWDAAVASVRRVLAPQHVVVIGVGRDPASPGRVVLHNMLGYRGQLSVVHPSAREIDGVQCVAAVGDLDAAPDLAIIAVPAAHVLDVVEQCGRIGVGAAVIISSGFAENGGAGIDDERALLDAARRYGMRIVGPNCLGVVATGLGLNATFSRQQLLAGSIAIASQSGGVGIVLAAEAAARRLGVSSFVSLGNKVDVSGNDLLRYWDGDPDTSVVLMYLESIGDPRRFARIARAVSRRLPIVALKSGRTEAGQRGARSHTAALAADDIGVDALFEHTGVLRATTLDQLLDVGALLAAQPAPAGRRVALIGNAGGPLILAADAATSNGLHVVELSRELQDRVRAIVPGAASTSNPVDLLATVDADSTRLVLDAIAASGEVDSCALVNVNLHGDSSSAAPLHLDWGRDSVPVVAVLLGGATAVGSMPTYPTPERAMDALGLAARRGEWLASTTDARVSTDGVDLLAVRQATRRLVEAANPSGAPGERRWLSSAETFQMLATLGVPVAPWAVATGRDECVERARELGFPCVLKAEVDGVVHKSDSGAVVLGVSSATAVRAAFADFRRRFDARLRHVVIQHQADAGVELLIGGVRDPAIGPLVAVAAGGTEAELVRDRSIVLAPLTEARATEALEALHIFPLLRGYRGRPVLAVEPVVDIVRRIGLLMAAVPEISELDLNPVIVSPTGCSIVDARIAVAPDALHPLRAMRRPTH